MTGPRIPLRVAAAVPLVTAVVLSAGYVVGKATSSGGTCDASLVHYLPYQNSPASLRKTPWVAASPRTSTLVGLLFYWRSTPWGKDGTRKPVFRIYSGGRAPGAGVHMKILWELRAGRAPRLNLLGTKLGAPGRFTESVPGGREFPSIVNIPTSGCWRLTLTAGAHRGVLTVAAVSR